MTSSIQPLAVELSQFRTEPTTQGYFLVLRRFSTGFWCEAYTTLLVHNAKQHTMISRLCFSSCTFQEMLNTCKAWGSVYGREFVVLIELHVRKLFDELEPWSPTETLASLTSMMTSPSTRLKPPGGSNGGDDSGGLN